MPLARVRRRITVALMTVLSVGLLTAADPPASAATGCQVAYTVAGQWSGGFTADVKITNLGDPITGWKLTWTFGAGQTVSQAWNATVAVASGGAATATNASYSPGIPTGGTAAFGFNGSWNGSNPVPTAFALNGVTCQGSTTTTTATTTRTSTTSGSTSTSTSTTTRSTTTTTTSGTGSTRYVFTAFTNASQSNMSVYTSGNGLNFTLLRANAYTPSSGAVRDPSVLRMADGTYYVAYTISPSGQNATSFGLARSTNLTTWTFVRNVPVNVSGTQLTWAPEFFVDADGSINIIVSLSPNPQSSDSDFRPYRLRAQDSSLTSWASATPLSGGFAGTNHIDTFVVRSGGQYHAFTKNETTKYIEHATANALDGPYTFVGSGNWSGWGSTLEGPSVTRLDNGTYRIYMDGYSQKRYFYADSQNLNSWTAKTEIPGGLSGVVRHGTVLRDV